MGRPELSEIERRVRVDVEGSLTGASAAIKYSLERTAAQAIAGVSHGLHGQIQADSDRRFVQKAIARGDADALEQHALEWGVPRKGELPAKFSVRFFGVNGSVIPIDTTVKKVGGTASYTTDAGEVVTDGQAVTAVTAVAPGVDGSVLLGEMIALGAPIVGVTSPGTVTAIEQDGADIEPLAAWGTRILEKIQASPKGGHETDYPAWAKTIASVSRAWAQGLWAGAGSVRVVFVVDSTDPIEPSPAKVTEVTDYIATQRPVTANVTVVGGVELPLDPVIEISPDTTAIREAVRGQLVAHLFTVVDLSSTGPPPGFLVRVSGTAGNPGLEQAIRDTPGLDDFTLVSPAADVQAGPIEVPVVGTVAFQ